MLNPCPPTPMCAVTIRSLAPKARNGTKYGAAKTVEAARNERRLSLLFVMDIVLPETRGNNGDEGHASQSGDDLKSSRPHQSHTKQTTLHALWTKFVLKLPCN